MHEAGLLAAAVAEIAAATGDRALARVELALGPGVDAPAAAQAWQRAAAGSPAQRAAVTFTAATDTLACLGCGREYQGDRLTRCPECGDNGLVVHPAHELEVVGWELEDAAG